LSFSVDVKKWDAKLQIAALQNLPSKTSTRSYLLTAEESKTEDGGLELEFVLSAKPNRNTIDIPFLRENIVLYYQPPLTEEFNKADCEVWTETRVKTKDGQEFLRPENIVGSYAVYHASKKGNNYKTGKICHIFRPKLIDADGKTVWADFNRDANETNVLIITLPQTFLNSAKYPVTVDPTFGKTSIGGTSGNSTAGYIRGSKYTLSENAEVTALSVYLDTATGNVKKAIYDASLNKVYADDVGQAVVAGWNTKSGLSVGLTAGDYWLVWKNDTSGTYYKYDAGTLNQGLYATYAYATAFPATLTPDGYQDRAYSIYATYTAGATLQTVTDAVALSDSVLRHKTFSVSDGVGVSDLARTDKNPLIVADALGLVDAILRNKQFAVTDAVALAELVDVIKGLILKTVADSIGLSDAVLRDKVLALIDAVALSDAVSTPSRILRALDQVGLADGALVNKVLQVIESISLVEVVEVGVGGAKKTKLFLVLGDLAIQLSSD